MPLADLAILQDPDRLEAVAATGLLDSPVNPSLQRLTMLAQRMLGVPSVVVTLIDRERQYFAAFSGLSAELEQARENGLDYSFCQHVVASASPMVVPNAAVHPLLFDNRAIPEMGVKAYAGMPLQSADGHMLGSFCAFDTTEREWSADDIQILEELARAAMTEIELRETARLLEEQGEQLSSLLESTRELVVQLGVDGTVHYANAAFRRTLGDPPSPPRFGWLRGELDTTSREAFNEAWRVVQERHESSELDLRFVPSGAAPVEVEALLVPTLVRGELKGVRFLANNVTDARALERVKDQLIGVVSHELRTPIGAVQGALQLLTRLLPEPRAPKAQEMLDLAMRNAARLLALVNDLLDLERLEAGQLPMERHDVPLADVFAIARDATSSVAEQRGVVLQWTPGASIVNVDADRVARVLINLVSNAVKFTPAGKHVRMSATVADDYTLVRVEDEGRGIPPESMERIFERFSQVARVDATEHGGTGLGLTIARAIVLAHGGRMWVESRVGEGSTFSFTLPRQR
jgi:signal transduction histidine kinase